MSSASTVLANGRFPRASMLIEDSRDWNKLTIAATYGLLVTDDRGERWYYVCDAAFSFQALLIDPVVSQVEDGSLLVASWTNIALSRDRACDWTKVLTPAIGEGASYASVDDFSVVVQRRHEVVAVVTTFQKMGPNIVQLNESTDAGMTWKPIGAPLPVARVYTVDIDPTNPDHIYATGFGDFADENAPELFLSSHDRGATWLTNPIPGTSTFASPWIAAIHPRDGNKIFVRTDTWKRRPGEVDQAGDALLYSEDGGTTWVTLLRPAGTEYGVAGAKLLGFALSPDGSTVLAGYGDPVDPSRIVDPDHIWRGIYKSSSEGRYSFGSGAPDAPVRIFKGSVSCLSWTARGIYACVTPAAEPQNLTFTTDPEFSSSSLTKLMKMNEVLGPRPCCRGRATSACDWRVDCQVLGTCDHAGPPESRICDGGDDGMAGGAPIDASSSDAPGGSTSTPVGDEGEGGSTGCGCRISRPVVTRGNVAMILAAAALGAARHRKRQARLASIDPEA
jgi:hypothetical protein